MSFKLDASKFKKIGGDRESTTLRHKDGHELTISHKLLSPKTRAQIAEIPHFEGGGPVDDVVRTSGFKQADNIHNIHQSSPSTPPVPAAQPTGTKGDTGYHNQAAADWNASHKANGGEVRHLAFGTDEYGYPLPPQNVSPSKQYDASKERYPDSVVNPDAPVTQRKAEGGSVESRAKRHSELKGINVGTVASDGKQSHAGAMLEHSGDAALPKMKAKQVLHEMKSMPKPKLMAEGGRCERCPCPSCNPIQMAEGGGPVLPQTAEQVTTAADHGAPAASLQFNDDQAEPVQVQPTAQPGMQDMDPNSPAVADGEQNIPNEPGVSPDFSNSPAVPTSAADLLSKPASAADIHNHLSSETDKLRQDFNNGHITPKTYGDLFADRGTLGKLGTMFALMVSGFGSGLSGQPNALLEMMNKTIERDLEAQKATKTNQFNALNLSETHFKNQIEQGLAKAQGANYAAQTGLAKANKNLLVTNNAEHLIKLGFAKQAAQQAGLIPENTPQGQKARAAAQFLQNAVDADAQKRDIDVSQKVEANGQNAAASPKQPSGYILSPGAEKTYQSLMSPYNDSVSPEQKALISKQYNDATQTEKALGEIDNLFPQLQAKATNMGSLADTVDEATHGVPGVGQLGKLPAGALRNLGGQTEQQYQTARDSFRGYVSKALESTGMTPTERQEIADRFAPTQEMSPETQRDKLAKLKEKIVTLTNTGAMDAHNMTNKKKKPK